MLETQMETINYLAGAIFSQLVNAAIPSAIAMALIGLLSWHKGWNAASRYCGWWLLLGLSIALPFLPRIERRTAEPAETAAVTHPRAVGVAYGRAATVKPEAVPKGVWPSPVSVFLFCWLAAACLQLVRLLRGFANAFQLKRSSFDPPAEIAALFEIQRQRLCAATRSKIAGTHRRPVIRLSGRIESPAVLGYRRPHILLPAALLQHLEPGELAQVMLHELAHVERWDDWTIALQRLAEAMGVFHPLICYLAHRMNMDREMASDDRVAALCQPREYAACLTRVAEIRNFGSASPIALPMLLGGKPELLARVESLLDRERAHLPAVSMARLTIAFACAATVGVAAAFTPRFLSVPAPREEAMELPAVPRLEAEQVNPQTQPPASTPKGRESVSSIAVTAEDGSTSRFGSWPGEDEKGETGTVTFSSQGKRYVIRDPATVAEAMKVIGPMKELGRKQSALGEQQSNLGGKQEELGAKQEGLVAAPLDTQAMKHLQEQLRDLENRLHRIDVDKELKTAREAMEKLGDLQEKIAEMQERMGSAEGLLGEKQGELGQEQGRLAAEQGWLGRLQGELGEQQARESQRAERRLEELIKRAQQHGLARPLP